MDAAAKKKPGLAVVIGIGKGKHPADDDYDTEDQEDGGDDEGYEAARDELADLVGVKEADREAFGDALRAFVMSCK